MNRNKIGMTGRRLFGWCLCAALLCVSLVGCSCQSEPGGSTSSGSTATTTTTAVPATTTATATTTRSFTQVECRSIGISLAVYYYTAAFAPGDGALHEAVAGALDALYADGTIDSIADRFFPFEVFPRDDGAVTPATSTDGSLERVKAKGKLVIGADPNAEPLSYQSADGSWHGYEVTVAGAVARALGVDARFIPVEPEDAVDALLDGRVDCLWGGCRYDSAHRHDVLYAARTEWMLEDSIGYYILKENSFDGESDLWSRDVTMVTLEGSFSERFIRQRMQDESVALTVRSEPTAVDCFQALKRGDAFVVVMDDLTAQYTLAY